jgi:preprotein translocase subunit SecD
MKSLFFLFLIAFAFVACDTAKEDSKRHTFEVRIAEDQPAASLTAKKDGVTGDTLYLHAETIINQSHIKETDISRMNDYYVVNIYLTEEGGKRMQLATSDNIEKRAAMLLDDEIISSPIIRDTIKGRTIMVNGNFNFDEAERIMSLIDKSIESE